MKIKEKIEGLRSKYPWIAFVVGLFIPGLLALTFWLGKRTNIFLGGRATIPENFLTGIGVFVLLFAFVVFVYSLFKVISVAGNKIIDVISKW